MRKKIVLSCALAFPIALIWEHMWMYNGILGPLALVERFGGFDGESAYDAVFVDMYLFIAGALSLIVVCLPLAIEKSGISRTMKKLVKIKKFGWVRNNDVGGGERNQS
jgi:hypothetical protein